jgi:multiple sugar transport system permease protein
MEKGHRINQFRRLIKGAKAEEFFIKAISTLILAIGAVIILIPFIYMISMALKDATQIRSDPLSLIPRAPITALVNGEQFPLYDVTIDGTQRQMALYKNAPGNKGIFIDPAQPEQTYTLELQPAEGPIPKPLYKIEIHLENFPKALTSQPFGLYFVNTMLITVIGGFGMLLSCTMVAYGFSRFRAPWLNTLFLLLLSTVMLPSQVRLIPIYVLFQKLGWINTLLPLIVPNFFANAYDVFMLRQFFMTIPLELDDAAKIDGANSFQTLIYIMLPQVRPAILAVAVFHFLYAWNDFYEPLIFLHTQEHWTMAVGLQTFNALYAINTHLIMAASIVMIIPPILLFFLAQRVFTQGIVFRGIKG